MWINTEEFSREAQAFMRNLRQNGEGSYINAPRGSKDWDDYWDLQEKYCREGFEVGGVKIPGEYYGYLNFAQIKLTMDPKVKLTGPVKKAKADKLVTFPQFWDGDAEYYRECELAREAGEHMIVLKARRKGYSYKNGWKCAHKYTFERNSISLIGAYEKKFLYPEGTMRMTVDYLDFLSKYTDFGKPRQHVNRQDHVVASHERKEPDGRIIKAGFRSQIMAVTFKDNPDAARGKDASLILFEEAGKFPNLKAAFAATEPSVRNGAYVTGQIYVFGTGGDMEGGTVDFESMFYDPKTYNFRAYDNTYDEGMSGNSIGFFVPDWKNKPGFIDPQGNSLKDQALNFENEQRENIRQTSKDPGVIDKHITEYPQTPKEATLQLSTNYFPKAELLQQEKKVSTDRSIKFLGVNGFMSYDSENRVTFQPSGDARPIQNFPIKPDVDGTGCIVQYQEPYKVNGYVPTGLYFIAHDPYGVSGAGSSLGATYVIKRPNAFTQPDDIIVAEYVARPHSQDDYNYQLFALAEYYNAKIAFENDRGNVIEYARRTHKLHMLEEEFDVYDKNDRVGNKLGRNYGMSMNNKERKKQGCIYLRDWLLTTRGKELDGTTRMNLHMIYSQPLLQELIKFDFDGNFDRVSALLIGMYYMKQLFMKPITEVPYDPYEDDPFFRRNNGGNSPDKY